MEAKSNYIYTDKQFWTKLHMHTQRLTWLKFPFSWVSLITHFYVPAFINRLSVNLIKSGLWVLTKCFSLHQLHPERHPSSGGDTGSHSLLESWLERWRAPKVLLWMGVCKIPRWFALVSISHSSCNWSCVILVYNSGSRWPRCGRGGKWPPQLQSTALLTKVTVQCELSQSIHGLSWDLRVILIYNTDSRWPRCGQRMPDHPSHCTCNQANNTVEAYPETSERRGSCIITMVHGTFR